MEGGTVATLGQTLLNTLRDVLPIAAVLFVFQALVLRRKVRNLRRVLIGFALVIAGLTFFLVGLEEALFPVGRIMARQLANPAFIFGADAIPAAGEIQWWRYAWVLLFGAAIGFATTIAEPALIAVSLKASDVSGGELTAWGLRLAVAVGVGLSIAVGVFRIVTGTPLYVYMIAGYAIVVVQTVFAPRIIVPLAYDSGGVTTSTVTVPLVTALGLGQASTVPGRSALIDGFGLIALASLFPMITVMGFVQLAGWRTRRQRGEESAAAETEPI